jgi:hypothetical protein
VTAVWRGRIRGIVAEPARAYANLFAPETREHFHPAADMAVFRQPGMI